MECRKMEVILNVKSCRIELSETNSLNNSLFNGSQGLKNKYINKVAQFVL